MLAAAAVGKTAVSAPGSHSPVSPAGETGEPGRGAASRLYLVRPVRRSNSSTISIRLNAGYLGILFKLKNVLSTYAKISYS